MLIFKDTCIKICVDKFAKVNQRLMTTYVEVQSKINEKRMVEYENQMKAAEAAAQQEVPPPPETEPQPVIEVSN